LKATISKVELILNLINQHYHQAQDSDVFSPVILYHLKYHS